MFRLPAFQARLPAGRQGGKFFKYLLTFNGGNNIIENKSKVKAGNK